MCVKIKYRECLFRKQSNYFGFWIVVSFIVILVFLFLTCFSYYPYYQITGVYRKEENYVSVLFESTRMDAVENVEIKVEDRIVQKEDILIMDYVVVDNKIYNQANVYLHDNFDKQLVSISIKLPKTTLWKQIWKGMME